MRTDCTPVQLEFQGLVRSVRLTRLHLLWYTVDSVETSRYRPVERNSSGLRFTCPIEDASLSSVWKR